MKKFLTFLVALVMAIPMMAIGRNDGSTKANAIDFDWNAGNVHPGGTLWYRVDLAPLYEEENPSLSLYMTNPSRDASVEVSMTATVAGEKEAKEYTIAAHQYKSYTANASMLVRMKQTEIYLTLVSDGPIRLSAKVFEATDLDETCKDAKALKWNVESTQTKGYAAWWKVDLTPAKNAVKKDARITITNIGSGELELKAGQSLDCPSSGLTKRTFTLAAGESLYDTIPQSMINSVQPDELYFSIENIAQPVRMKVELIDQPVIPVIPATMPLTALHVTDTIEPLAAGTYLFWVTKAEMNALAKYEPEFTYRNNGAATAHVSVKMAFHLPAFGTSNTDYELAAGEEEIVVYKKNMLEGLDEDVDTIYLLTTIDQPIHFYGRYKHVREGKACKTNIDFNWETGHRQEARTTQWYAIDVADARDNLQDIIVYVQNEGTASAKVKASLAFSCPYIDLQETSRTIAANSTPVSRRLGFSSYAMMSDTVWIGLETSQDIRFWATTQNAVMKAEADTMCLHAVDFNWEEGVRQNAGDTVWYRINMEEVRDLSAKFPTVFVQNMNSTKAAKITAELSLECPDEIENQKRSLTIAANGSYSKKLSRNLFENIVQDEIYLRVVSTQDVALQIRLSEESEGTNCASAIPFNWVSGNTQAANVNLWYKVDLREVMRGTEDLNLTIENTSGAECKGVGQLTFGCPDEETPSVQSFTLAAHEVKTIFRPHSALYLLPDSMVYINLQGSTALRISAERVAAAPFTPISGVGLTMDTLLLDASKSTVPAAATQWYLIPKEEIAHLLEMNEDQPFTPTIQIENSGSEAYNVAIDAAFAFPVTETMIGQQVTVGAGQTFAHTLDYKLFMRAIRMHDSVFVRITIPAEAVGSIRIKSGMNKAFNGNSRYEALPFRIGEIYNQQEMTSIWYRINAADLKKDKDLYNKRIMAYTKNLGTGKAKISVSIYEGFSEEDLLEKYGLEDYRERKMKKGQSKKQTFPAQAIYALGDVDLYILVTTDQKIGFRTRFSSIYDSITPDPKQQEATLLVPNVDYVIPGDNEEHWYMVCFPYIRNNYKYEHAATMTYEVTGKATVYTTATLQDTMDCKMPVRKRVLNRKGGHYTGTKYLSTLLGKAIKKATKHDFDLTTFQEDFVDEQLRHFLTSDSLTGYVRIKTDKDLRVRINLLQVTGEACTTPMPFDWEHGNVNPAGADMWYHVQLDSLVIPDTCDLRIHVDNWSNETTTTVADIYFDCNDPKTTGANYTLEPGEGNYKDIDRDFLSKLGWADMIINYTSDKTSHIWAELVPNKPREYDYDTITAYVCQGGSFTDTITGEVFDPVDFSMQWNDTVTWQDGVTMRDSVTTFYLYPLVMPEILSVSEMKLMGATPLLVQGMQLFVDSSNVKLMEYYQNLGSTVDTIIAVDTVYWAEPVYKSNGDLDIKKEKPLNLTSFYAKNQVTDTLLLVLKGGCETVFRTDVVFPIEDYKYASKNDTICPDLMPAVNPDTLSYAMTVTDTLGLPRYIDTIVTYYTRTQPELYASSEIFLLPTVNRGEAIDTLYTLSSLKQQFIDDAEELTMAVIDAKWQVQNGDTWQDLPYSVLPSATSVTMQYVITTECGDQLTSENILFTFSACVPTASDTAATACDAFEWHGKTYTASGLYKDTLVNVAGCDSIVTLNLTINTPTAGDTTAMACDAFEWHGKTYTASGLYKDTILNYAGCDSIITLHLTVNRSSASEEQAEACESYDWHGKTYTETGIYKDTVPNYAGCDSIITLHMTINNSIVATPETYDECNLFVWHGETYTASGTYYDTLSTIHGCDSVCQLNLTITTPYDTTLSLVHKFGNRLLMINRNEINALPGWQLDSLDEEHPEYVSWYEIDLNGDTTKVWEGYYYTLASGEPLPAGYTYYAVVNIPASEGAKCGAQGTTESYTIPLAAGAPALMPSLAKPGEDIRIINLDPDAETVIRIYTSDGLLHGMYTTSGQESSIIKAAYSHGFYIVELSSESMKSTLRYIVK